MVASCVIPNGAIFISGSSDAVFTSTGTAVPSSSSNVSSRIDSSLHAMPVKVPSSPVSAERASFASSI